MLLCHSCTAGASGVSACSDAAGKSPKLGTWVQHSSIVVDMGRSLENT